MKLSEVIEVWEMIHVMDIGELGFGDMEKAIDEVVGIENDVSTQIGATRAVEAGKARRSQVEGRKK